MTRLARLAAITFALALCPPAVALGQAAPPTLHVVGHGRVFVVPDRATVTINVHRSAATRGLARGRVNTSVARIIHGLVGIGIDRATIQTTSITLGTTNLKLPHHRHRTSYSAEIDLTVTTKRLSLLSPLFEVASRGGASSFTGPSFDFSDPSAGLSAAAAAALRDARRRADAAAAVLGVHVVGVQSVDLDPGSSSGSAPPASSAPVSRRSPTSVKTPVLTGRQEVDVDVNVVYELGS